MRPVWAARKAEARAASRADTEYSLDTLSADGFEIPSNTRLTEKIVLDKLLLEMLHRALRELTKDERAIIDALFYEEKTERQVARDMGVSQNAVNKRKNRVLEKLRRFFEK